MVTLGLETTLAWYSVDLMVATQWICDRKVVGSTPCRVAISTCTGDCLSQYITSTKVNSAFHPPGAGKSRTACLARVMAGRVYLCQVADAR